jgi:3-dehydrosphinganine reductase
MWMLLFWLLVIALVTLVVHMVFVLRRPKCSLKDKSVVITGGSKGIGKALAIEVAQEGPASIVLIARNIKELNQAKEEIEKKCISQKTKVITISCDVTDKKQVRDIVNNLSDQKINDVDFLFLVHGMSIPGYIVEQEEEIFERQMQLNYFGGVYVTKAILPMMMNKRGQQNKHIVFVSSAACLCTFIGYGSYAPTKYAIRGFAESLHNELQGHGISVHISIPSDTDTEGFKRENETKPKECLEISGIVKVEQPEQPARAILRDMKKNKFFLFDSFDFDLLVTIGQGITPRRCPVWDPVKAFIGTIVSFFIQYQFAGISRKHAPTREKRFRELWNKK